jgi:hypothetical protein
MAATTVSDTDCKVTYAPSHPLQPCKVASTSSSPFTSSKEKDETPIDADSSAPSSYRKERTMQPSPIVSPLSIASVAEKHLDNLEPRRNQHLNQEAKLYKVRVDILYNLNTTPVSATGVTR